MIGSIFGRLTVIVKAEPGKRGFRRWLCQCDCGNQTVAFEGNLKKSKNTRSCGCLSRELSSQRNRKDMIGKRFGKLVVVKDTGERSQTYRSIRWECVCDCGKKTIAPTGHLVSRHTKSCGHCNEISSGQQFGKLTAVAPTGEMRHGSHEMWECMCKCGRTAIVSRECLNNGTTQSCGCISRTEYDGFRFRSKWEVYWYIASRLRGLSVEYEPLKITVTIDDRDRTYTPDFRIAGTQRFFEVKGRQFPIGMKKREWANAHGYDITLVTRSELEAWCGCSTAAMSEAFSKGGCKKVKSLIRKSLRGIIGRNGSNAQLRIPIGQTLYTAA